MKVKQPFVYVGGTTWTGLSLSNVDMAVVCFNISDGSVEWEFTWDQGFGYEEVDGLVVETDGIYLAGWTTGENTQNDIAVLKLDLDGNLIWSQSWGTDGWDEANGHIVVDENKIYVAGRYNAPGSFSGGSAVLAVFDKSTGDYLWHRTWQGSTSWTPVDDAFGMTTDSTSLYLVGITNIAGNGSQIFLLKYDLSGNLIWERTWGGNKGEAARAILITQDGDILIGGKTNSEGAGENDIVLLKYNAEGTLIWSKIWGGSDIDEVHDMVSYGNVLYIAGETNSYGSGKNDALLIKVDNLLRVTDQIENVLNGFHLDQNYPNPFNPETVIEYQLPRASEVEIIIFNLQGQKVAMLVKDNQTTGFHKIRWNGTDESGQPVVSGVYLYQLTGGNFVAVKKMLLLR